MSDVTFGQLALGCDSAAALLELERDGGHGPRFTAVEKVLGVLAMRAMGGERVVRITRGPRDNGVELVEMSGTLGSAVHETFGLQSQQARAHGLREPEKAQSPRSAAPASTRQRKFATGDWELEWIRCSE